ncbi:MAG: membrane protein insertase YidC [Thermoanaerobaculia bacterium]
MDTRRLFLAFLLSLAVLLLWGKLFPPPEPPETSPAPVETAAPAAEELTVAKGVTASEQPLRTGSPAPEVPLAPAEESGFGTEPMMAEVEERTVVETELFRAELTNRGAKMITFEILDHQNSTGGPVDLVRARRGFPYPFALVGGDGESLAVNESLFVLERGVAEGGSEVLTYTFNGPAGSVEKQFTFRPDGLFEVEVTLAGARQGWGLLVGPGIRNPGADELGNRFAQRSAVYRVGKEVEKVNSQSLGEPTAIPAAGLRWIGLQDTYFLTAAIPETGLGLAILEPVVVLSRSAEEPAGFFPFRSEDELSEEQEDLSRELLLILQADGERLSTVAFWGAKEYERLEALPYGLEKTVDLGWFRPFSLILLKGLRWIYDHIVPNYGWAIILLTVVIRIVLFPLTHKSTVSMQKMQKLNPKIQAIRQKYRGKLKDKKGRPSPDAQKKMNEEIMALYKSEGVNPAGGCLPMVLQIPVLFAFYRLLSAAIELRGAPWMMWIQDLSLKDPLYVLPIVMGASQFLQQKMTPAAGDPMQRRMFAMMPIFFTVLFLGFPSGMVLYWLTNNLLGILQQIVYKKIQERREETEAVSSSGASKSKPGAS